MKKHLLVECPDFRRFFCGRVVSAVGDKFYTIALVWWVLSHKGSPGILVGILMASNILPVILFGPLAGTLADRWDKRKCMLYANLARITTLSLILILSMSGQLSLPVLYFLVFCTSAFSPLFESAATSSIPNLVKPDKLPQATTLNASVIQFSNLIGAALGGLFLAVVSINAAIAVNVASFMVSFFLILGLKADLKPHESMKKEPYGRQVLEGFRYIVKVNRPIGWMLALFGASNFFASSIMFFIPVVVKTVYNQPVTWVGIMEGSLAAGFVLVSFVLSFISKSSNAYVSSFIGGWAIFAAFALFLLDSPIIASTGLFLMGLAIAWSGSSMQIMFHRTVEPGMRGRLFALMTTVVYIGLPSSFLFNGFLSGVFPVKSLLLFNGIAVLVLTFGFLVIPRKEVKPETAACNAKGV